jgi:hypothetical protein
MSWTPPPRRPILYVNETQDAQRAQALLERYDIDFEIRHTEGPVVSLYWNGTTYTDLFGVAEFLMFAGRLPIAGVRKGAQRGDGEPPGFRIRLT